MISDNSYQAVTFISNGFFLYLFINNYNFQELFPAIHYNLFIFKEKIKRIFVAIVAMAKLQNSTSVNLYSNLKINVEQMNRE